MNAGPFAIGAAAANTMDAVNISVLEIIDVVLAGLALGIVARLLLVRATGRAPRPIFTYVGRENRIDEITVAWGFGAYLLAGALFGTAARLVDLEAVDPVAQLGAGTAAQLAGTWVCLLLVGPRTTSGVRGFLLGSPPHPQGMGTCLAGVMLLALGLCPALLMLTVWAARTLLPDFDPVPHPTLTALSGEPLSTGAVALLWFGAAVVAPFAEEVFFRGILQSAVRNMTRSPRAAILVASVVFAAVHLSQPHAIPALLFLGVSLGTAYERTGSLLVPVIVHAAFNLRTLIWQSLGAGME